MVTSAQAQLENTVPPCPQGLCISRADFLRTDFTVDKFFIEQSIRETPLDNLRDDLGLYLKVLRSSMIELINQDYADFVNLSTNLVGLDGGILALQEPLSEFNGTISTVNNDICSSLDVVRRGLAKQKGFREDREVLASLRDTSHAIARLERVVAGEIGVDSAERLATEINQVQFAVWRLGECKLVQEQYKPRLEVVCDKLNSWLDSALLDEIQGEGEELARLRRVYSSIGRVEAAECVVRENVVRPSVSSILEVAHGGGEVDLEEICSKLLSILKKELGGLLSPSLDSRSLTGSSEGFNFLENSFWPEVVEQWLASLNNISSASLPSAFHKNYTISLAFLASVEEHCRTEESLEKLRGCESTTAFLAAWNLPLYFQIRFQEVARPLEETFGKSLAQVQGKQVDSLAESPKLEATVQLIAAVNNCFSPSIFIRPLAGRFLKLALQCIARYKVWAEKAIEQFGKGGDDADVESSKKKKEEEAGMKRSSTSTNLSKEKEETLKKSTSAQGLADVKDTRVTLDQVILLHSDIDLLLPLLNSCIASHLRLTLPDLNHSEPLSAVSEAISSLSSLPPLISEALVRSITANPLKQLKGVLEIPRMYRRTNREPPRKPCPYVVNISTSLITFASSNPHTALASWLIQAKEVILAAYQEQVSDVLGNVSKMEESLRKLKKVRERQETREAKPGLSDDDKIRLQLYVDVHFLLGKLTEIGAIKEGCESQENIANVVDEPVAKFIKDVQNI